MTDIKFCKDCRFCVAPLKGIFRKRPNLDQAICCHPKAAKPHNYGEYLVTGIPVAADTQCYCVTMRQNRCGKEAKFFEAKETTE